ncbi:MAG: deoxyguanosinetriphosphate triphosphohydrolase [Mariprofundaceae bacterium]
MFDAYEKGLAIYACRSGDSRGRSYVEAGSGTRSMFQRDRDRIVHSTAFRRLEYKTQVFVNHEGDHYRTRLTHSIEVAQIARSICRAMALHEDLAEAVALAHDLGHTPFGHSGQDVLHEIMKPYGGFEHNRQSLRIVKSLELRYPAFPGLNLSYETREGLVKHHSPHDCPAHQGLSSYNLSEQATLEAQIANLADEIAYNNHDVDDGFRAGMLDVEGLCSVALFKQHYDKVCQDNPNIESHFMVSETIRFMINFLIVDVIEETKRRISEQGIQNLADVRASKHTLVGFSKPVRKMNGELKKYLFKHMYHHYRVARMAAKAEYVIKDIFTAYMKRPEMLPDTPRALVMGQPEIKKARRIADYIAGMTDRYALDEHDRLFAIHART